MGSKQKRKRRAGGVGPESVDGKLAPGETTRERRGENLLQARGGTGHVIQGVGDPGDRESTCQPPCV